MLANNVIPCIRVYIVCTAQLSVLAEEETENGVISKQRILQLYFEPRLVYANLDKVLTAEGCIVPKQTVWATIRKYKLHGTLSLLPGSGHRFKLTPSILSIIEEQMRMDDEKAATQLVKIVNTVGYNVSKSTTVRA